MNRFGKDIAGAVAAFLALCAFQAFAAAQEKKPAVEKVRSLEGITEYRLPNGLHVLLFPDDSAPKVTVNMTVLVGSRHEGYGETGMAHLLEHMLFKGSTKFPEADKALQQHGASFNGTTFLDRTNYYETMPATDENLKFGIEFEADRLVNCFVKREDLVKEMTVVRNEFERGENNPQYILYQRMLAVAFEWHNYGKSTIGNRSDIERVPIENLQAFYRKFYQPDNVVLTIAGRFDEKKALGYVAEYFGPIPRPKRILPKTWTDEPAQDGERFVTLRRVGKVPLVGTLFHTPSAAHPDNPAVEVLARVLGNSPSGRYYKALVETKNVSSVGSFASSWHDPGILMSFADVVPGADPEAVKKELIDLAVDFKPASKEEVERAKQEYLAERNRALTNSQTIARELSEWISAGDWRLLFWHRDMVAKVTPQDVDAAAEKYLRRTNMTVGMFLPTDKAVRTYVPPGPEVAEVLKDYKGGKALAKGEVFEVSPENIEKRVKRVELPGGLKVALLEKKTRGAKVVASMAVHYGNEKSLTGKVTAARFLGDLMRRGTKKHSYQELEDALNKLESSLSVSSDVGRLSVGIQSKREHLGAVLDLLREVLREPTFPESEFEIMRRERRQAIQQAMVSEQALAFQSLQRKLNPYPKDDIRYVPDFKESLARLEAVSRDEVAKLYAEQVAAGKVEIALVGDFDADDVLARLKSLFADWQPRVPYERIATKAFTDIKPSTETIQVPDKAGAVFVAGLNLALNDQDPRYAALTIGNYILGGNFNSRLFDRLRQKEGWSYGARSYLTVDAQDKDSSFLMFAICNPGVIDKVDRGAVEELTKLVKKGVDSEELSLAQKAYVEEQKVGRANDATLVGQLRLGLYLGRDYLWYAERDRNISGLTPDQVNRALAETLHPDRLTIVRAGDFTKKGAEPKKK